MSDASDTTYTTGAPDGFVPPGDVGADERRAALAHKTFRVLLIATTIAILVAIALNWWLVGGIGDALPGHRLESTSGIPEPETIALDKSALEMLPERVLQFETITRQPIPGAEDRSAEAVYRTLNMNLEAQIGIVVYARVEAFASSGEASARQDELMADYTLQQTQRQLGSQIVASGFTEDKQAYAQSWSEGQYVTFVKSSFDEWIPAIEKELTVPQGDKIADAVEVYQRTGREGVSK